MAKSYYSIPEYAKVLGVSRISIYNKVKKGQIKAVRMGRNFFIPKSIDTMDNKLIDMGIKKIIDEYGEVLEKLGKE